MTEVKNPERELPLVHLFTIFLLLLSNLSEIKLDEKAPFADKTKGFQKKVNGL